jgi:hypothetical protein
VIPSCKGRCDDALISETKGSDGWKDVSDFTNPLLFMQNSMAFIDNVKEGKFSDEAFEAYKKVLLTGYQYVLREPTDKDWHDCNMDRMMPF